MNELLNLDYEELDTKTSEVVDRVELIAIDEIVDCIEAGSIAIEKVMTTYDDLLAATNEYITLLESDMGSITKSIETIKSSDEAHAG